MHSFFYFLPDPLGIVVYNDLPDGACFTRSTLARDSARSCPSSAASAASVTSKFRGSGKTKTRPTTLSKNMMRATDGEPLVYETVDKPAEVGYFFQLHIYDLNISRFSLGEGTIYYSIAFAVKLAGILNRLYYVQNCELKLGDQKNRRRKK